MDSSYNISVMVLDDHQLVLDGIRLMLDQSEGFNCLKVFRSGKNALDYLKKQKVDIILTDVEMPEMSGIEFCKKVKKGNPTQKVIALTMLVQHSVINNMTTAGCDGFLIKNSSSDELLFAIKEVYEGRSYFSREVREKMESGLIREGSTAPIPRLSRREKDIVRLILDQKNTNEIADLLFISPGTVETHRRNIMNKLGTKNAAGLVKFVIENRLI